MHDLLLPLAWSLDNAQHATYRTAAMKLLALLLTVLLADSFSVEAACDCAPTACCPPGECQCHVAAPVQPASTPGAPATAPVPVVFLIDLPVTLTVPAIPTPSAPVCHCDWTGPPPAALYLLTHALLI